MNELASDRLEASSLRYGVWLRLAWLSSGRWAVYHETEDSGGKETGVIEVFDLLDLDYLRGLSINEQAKLEEQRVQNLLELEARTNNKPLQQAAKLNLEDMGL